MASYTTTFDIFDKQGREREKASMQTYVEKGKLLMMISHTHTHFLLVNEFSMNRSFEHMRAESILLILRIEK